MKHIFLFFALFLSASFACAQTKPGDIVGCYTDEEGAGVKIRIEHMADDSYRAIMVQYPKPPKGQQARHHDPNPDSNVVFNQLRFNPKKQKWDGGRMRTHKKDITIRISAKLESPNRIAIKGSYLAFSDTFYMRRCACPCPPLSPKSHSFPQKHILFSQNHTLFPKSAC